MEIHALDVFTLLFGSADAVGIVMLLLLTIWLGSYRGGLNFEMKDVFNWHPLLMTTSLIFLSGNAMLTYRAFRYTGKKKLKIAHTIINGAALSLSVIGVKTVFDSHNFANPPIPNLYSLHSWIGIAAVFCYCCQWLVGLVVFLYPTLPAPLRALYLPIHVFFGIAMFVCSAACALTGLTEKAIFSVKEYSGFVPEGLIINCIGVFIIVFSCLVLHLAVDIRYKRQPLPEDQMLLTENQSRQKKTKSGE